MQLTGRSQNIFQLALAILAAGHSSRMGSPKPLLPWGHSSVIAHIVRHWRSLGAIQIAVVSRPGDTVLEAELIRLGFAPGDWIINPSAEQGMFSSIQAAARWPGWNTSSTHFAIALADQPQIATSTLQKLRQFALDHPNSIVQPSVFARPKHPVILPVEIFQSLANSQPGTLRDFLEAHRDQRKLVEIDDPGLNFDLDTPADYQRALQLFSPG